MGALDRLRQKANNEWENSSPNEINGALDRLRQTANQKKSVKQTTKKSTSNGYAPVADLNRATNGAGVSPLEQAARDVAATPGLQSSSAYAKAALDNAAKEKNAAAKNAANQSLASRLLNTVKGSGKLYAGELSNAAAVASDTVGGTAMSQTYRAQVETLDSQIAALENQLRDPTATAQDVREANEALRVAREQRALYADAVRSGENTAGEAYKLADELSAGGAQDIERAKAGASALGKVGIDLLSQGVQMGADALLGAAIGIGGLGVMGARTFGGGAQEARQAGADTRSAALYGMGTAAVEMLTEKLADGVAGIYGKGAADDVVKRAIGRLTQNAAAQNALGVAAAAAGESVEEFISGIVNPALKTLYNGKSVGQNYSELEAGDVLYDMLIGGIMGAVGGTVDTVARPWRQSAETPTTARRVSEAEPVAAPATNDRAEISEPSTPQRISESETREALPLRGVSEQQLDRDLADAARLSVTLGRSGANAFLTAYDRATAASMDPTEAFESFSKVYNAAVRGENAPKVSMPEHLRIAAQGAGENDAKTAAQARYFGENAGLAPNRSDWPRNLSRREARALDAMGKVQGVQIRFGKTLNGANASLENGVLTIAKDAHDPVRVAASHETVHRVRESAPEAYATLAQFVVDNMSDERLASAIRARADAYSDMNYNISDITEEVVADAFGRMASEPELLEKIAGVDRTAAQKLLDAIDELLRKIKAALSGKEQAQLTADQIEAFRDLQGRGEEMAKALRAALQKVQEQAQAAAIELSGVANASGAKEAEASEIKYSRVIDEETLDWLNKQKTVKAYRAMQVIDGKLYPPMAAKVASEWTSKRQLVEPTELNAWYRSDERPDLVDPKTGKFKLDKANGATIEAAYNPYFHTSATPLNDQFSSAYKRPNLVTVEVEIPESELTSGYKAQYAKDSVGETKWHAGPVASQLKGEKARRVFLSRWAKVNRIVPDAEVAQIVARTLEGENIAVPYKVVTPSLRAELEKAGVQIDTKGEKNTATEDDAARYSLRTFEDGTKYVDVDVDQSIFDGLSVSEMQKAAKNEITKRFKGKVIGTDYTTYVDRNSARHYAYPANRRMDTQQKQNKMRASTELDNIVAASMFRENVPDDGRHPTATGGLDKLDTVFRVNGRTYKAEITVLVTGRGRIFYDLTKFKDITGRETGQTQSVAETSNNVSADSIPDTEQKSNTQNGEKRESRKSVADAEEREARYSKKDEAKTVSLFERAFDNWASKGKRGGETITIGNTPSKLSAIGIDPKPVRWNTSKLNRIQKKHPYMTDIVLKQASQMVENPVLVTASKTQANRVVLLGEAYVLDKEGREVPVLAALELLPTRKGYELNDYRVASAYAKESKENIPSREATQALIDSSRILYIEPDKKRTQNWLDHTGLQLPFAPNQFGVIDSITLIPRDVNGNFAFGENSAEQKTAMQAAFEKARAKSNTQNGEKRESRKSVADAEEREAALLQENDLLREEIKYWKAQLERTPEGNVGIVDPNAVRKTAKKLIADYGSTLAHEEITDELLQLYNLMGTGSDSRGELSYESAREIADSVARKIAENAVDDTESAYRMYEDLRSFLRTMDLTVTAEETAEIADWGDWRKQNFGRMQVKRGETSNIDRIYDELSDQWPEFFPGDVLTVGDQLNRIAEVADYLYRDRGHNPYDPYMDQAVIDIGNDIMERFFDLPQAKTFADKQAAKLETLRARMSELRTRDSERLQRSLAKVRESRDKQIERMTERFRAKTEEGREKQSAAKLRKQIMRHTSALSQKLLRPTDKQHIPDSLRAPVAAMLEAINLESGYDYSQSMYLGEKAERVPRGEGDILTKRTQAFAELKKQYTELKDDENLVIDPDLLGDEKEGFQGLFDQVLAMSGTPIQRMSTEQLQTIWKVVRAVEHSVSTYGKTLAAAKFKTTADWASRFRDDTKDRKDRATIGGKDISLGLENPYTFFSQYGESGKAIFRMLRDAQDTQRRRTDRIAEAVHGIVDSKTVKELRETRHEFTTERGDALTLTTAQIMELYNLTKREQAQNHLLKGGIVQPEIQAAGKQKRIERGTDMIRLTQADLGELAALLTPEQMEIADALQQLTATTLAEWGNEASMAAYGYRKFTERNYWPIHTAQEALHSKVENDRSNPRSIKNIGMAKALVPNASNAVSVGDVFTTFAEHAADMIDYSSWLLPMEDANRLFNFKYKGDDGYPASTFKQELDRVGGRNGKAQKYWTDLMADIQNGLDRTSRSDLEGLAARGIGNVKGASVGANLRVIVQQPTAYLRANAVMNPESLTKGLIGGVTHGNGWQKAQQYAAIARIKDVGGFDQGSTRSVSNELYGDRTALEKVGDIAGWPAGKADAVTWGALWNAAEWETKRLHPELADGSAAFYQKAAEIFTDVIDQTQVVDGVLQRSAIMRSGDRLTQQMTAFMGEPIMALNLMLRSYDNVRYAKTKEQRGAAIRQLGRAVVTLAVTDLVNSAVQSLVDALRKDDKDKKYRERFMTALTGLEGDEKTAAERLKNIYLEGNFADNVSLIGKIPLAKDLRSILQGFTVERMDAGAISDLMQSAQQLASGKYAPVYGAYRVAEQAAKIVGIPATNLERDVHAAVRSIFYAIGDPKLLYEYEKAIFNSRSTKNKSRFFATAYMALEQGDTETYESIRNDLVEKMGVSAFDVDDDMKKRYNKAVKEDGAYTLPQASADLLALRQKYSVKTETEEEKFKAEDLGAAAYTRYSNQRARDYKTYKDALEKTTEFRKLSAEDKDRALNWAYSLADEMALEENSDGQYKMTDKWKTYAKDAKRYGISMTNYLTFHMVEETTSSTRDKDGKEVKGQKKADKMRDWLENRRGLTDGQRAWLWGTEYDSEW